MLTLIIEILFKILGYALLLFGISQLVYSLVIDAYRLQKRKFRMKQQHNDQLKKVSNQTMRIHEHIKLLVLSVSKKPSARTVFNFYMVSLSIFLTTFLVLYILVQSFLFSLGMALLAGAMPYIVNSFKLINIRLEIRYAFMKEFHVFLQAYQQNRDVYHSLVDTVGQIKNKQLKMAFMRILSSMQKERTLSAFQESMRLFNFTVRGSYTTRFANLLTKQYRESANISESLLDLHADLQKREKDLSALKSRRMETVLLGYLPLIILPILVIMAQQMSIMFSTHTLLNQTNVSFFMVALTMAVACAFSAYLLNKPDADI